MFDIAKINGIYIHVTQEAESRSIDSTSHPTESGLPITSSIKKNPVELSLTGYIVDNDKYDAMTTKDKIIALKEAGSLITYQGRNNLSNMQIQSFDGDYDNKVWGGFAFTMSLKQIRVAKSSYTGKEATQTAQKEEKKANPSLKVGDTVVFKGGSVYVSSDAAKPAANRGRSTCKITIINEREWSKHDYHLISQDGGKVYGWVDKANIEGVPSSSTGNKQNSGTQQTTSGKGTAVKHTVRKGDTVYALTNKYKTGWDCKKVIDSNPDAFSRAGDPTTLQIGKILLMGYK